MSDISEIYVWGSDHFGQLGLNNNYHKTYPIPTISPFQIEIKLISCGEQHSAIVSKEGHLYTMGSNIDGRLGIGSHTIKFSARPCQIDSLSSFEIISVACGGGHSVALTSEGFVYSWGNGESGALGLGSLQNQFSPIKVPVSSKVIQISCGAKHSAIVSQGQDFKNSVLMCGNGESGQLGTGKRQKELNFFSINTPEEMVQVSCGLFHTCFLSRIGNVYVVGGNSFGQLGLGNKKGSCLLVKIEGFSKNPIKKVKSSNFSAAICESGEVYVWGTGVFGEFTSPVKIMNNAKDFEMGFGFLIILDEENRIFSYGKNNNGELGLGDFENRLEPCIIKSLDGKIITNLACGDNFSIISCESTNVGAKIKKSNPLRMPQERDNEGFKITLHESPKGKLVDLDRFERLEENYSKKEQNWDIYGTKNLENIEKKLNHESEVIGLKKINESLTQELLNSKREISKILQNLEIEQSKSSNYARENESLKNEVNSEKNFSNSLKESLLYSTLTHENETKNQKNLIDEHKQRISSLEIECKNFKSEVNRLQNLVKQQQQDFESEISFKLDLQNKKLNDLHNHQIINYQQEIEQLALKIKQLENSITIINSHKNRLEDSIKTSNETIKHLENELSQVKVNYSQQIRNLEHDLEVSNENFHKNEYSLNLANFNKKQLEEKLYETNLTINELHQEVDFKKNKIFELEQKIFEKENVHNKLWDEYDLFKKNALIQESSRENTLKLIEEKLSQIEQDRTNLNNEKIMLNNVIRDLNYEINNLNSVTSEDTQIISSLKSELVQEIEKNKLMSIDLETAKEQIILLELKNSEIFESLQKELAQRAKDYKERTINLLSTTSHSFSKSPEKENNFNYTQMSVKKSPEKVKNISIIQEIEVFKDTPNRSTSLSRVQQEKINTAALKIMGKPESPLKFIRISSPARKSPERPSQFNRKYIRGTPNPNLKA